MPTTTEPHHAGSGWRRIAWFIVLWVAGVASVGAVAAILRWAMGLH